MNVRRPDFSALGRELQAGGGDAASSSGSLSVLWRSESGATIFVGNQTAARSADLLAQNGITHIVNCTDDLPNFHAARFKYLKFNIAHWQAAGHADYKQRSNQEVVAFLDSGLKWIDSALTGGGSVLVHCLAGAHRAGTTGILCLMYKDNLSAAAATATAKERRKIIDPIFDFAQCLTTFEAAQRARSGGGQAPKA